MFKALVTAGALAALTTVFPTYADDNTTQDRDGIQSDKSEIAKDRVELRSDQRDLRGDRRDLKSEGHVSDLVLEQHPAIKLAMDSLDKARDNLQHANRDYGGHRAKAVQAIDNAKAELNTALQFDITH